MFFNYLKIAFRNMKKQKVYSTINILGLAVGMAGCLLITLWIRDEMSFDRFNRDGDRIYRIVSDWQKWNWEGVEITPGALGPRIPEKLPAVEHVTRIVEHFRSVVRQGDRAFYETGGLSADPDLFRIFSFPFVRGSVDDIFKTPFQIVITESFGRKYFGQADPLGQYLEINGQRLNVCGVVRDIPAHSHLKFDYVTATEHMPEFPATHRVESWSEFNYTTYIKVKPGADLDEIAREATAIAQENGSNQVKEGARFRLQPLMDIHLDPRPYQRVCFRLGDKRNIWIFSIIALFVLLIACVNFINLSTARSDLRIKEVGFRKTVGATRPELMKQFFSESMFHAVLACLIAILLAELALPLFNHVAAKDLTLDYSDPFLAGSLVSLVVICGGLAGVYPAMVLSSFKPVQIFRYVPGSRQGRLGFRGALVILQFTLSILLTIVTLAGYMQIRYIQKRDLGFVKENVLTIPVSGNIGPRMATVKQELLTSPHIQSVSPLRYLFTETMWRTTTGQWEGRTDAMKDTIDIAFNWSDADMLKTTGMELVAGRGLDPSLDETGVLVNEELVRQMGMTEPVGKWFMLGDTQVTIVGVLKDAYVRSLHEKVNPHIFMIQEDWASSKTSAAVLIRFNPGQVDAVLAHVRGVWQTFNPDSPFEYHFMDESYDQLYRKEYRVLRILQIFTLFALGVSCLGLFGLISFTTQRKAREIGIRKTLGASAASVVVRFSRRFLFWVLVGNVIAWPVGYYLVGRMLERFTYRVEVGLSVFLASALLAAILAMITVAGQSWIAASANPVDSIRDE